MLGKNLGFIKGRYVYLLQMLLVALFLTGCEVSSSQIKAVIDVSATHVATGTNVVFNASASSGGKGQIVSYVWKDETNNVVLNETVTFSHAFVEAKKHTISLTVVNTLGESSQAEVVIDVYSADTTPPVITLNGESNMTLMVGDTYVEPGATAVDDRDGNISDKIQITGKVDTNTTGTYTVKYSVADKAGNSASIQRVVNVKEDNTTIIEELKKMLDDPTVPYTTDADFNKTEYAKHHLPEDEAERLERAHYLVATAIDPDPEWFYTDVDKPVIVTGAGTEHTVTLKKMRKDGTVYAPVDNDKLRLVVRVQRSKDEFEYITNVNIDQYAHWDGAGILKIHVPEDLDKGRLIVGVRPNLTDVAASAIAERWSTVITAEVWQVKAGVHEVDSKNVLFPVDDASVKGLSPLSKFTLDEIKEKVQAELGNNDLLFPMVVQNMSLSEGDKVSYSFQGKPYSGEIVFVEHRDGQDFILLAPKFFDVYDITDADDGFMIKEGVYPENVIIREGDRLNSDTNESDPVVFEEKRAAKSIGNVVNYFEEHCSVGKGVLNINTVFNISPLDVGLDVSVRGLNKETKCEWVAGPDKLILNPAYFAVGGPVAIAMKALGMRGELTPFGKLEITTKGALGLGIEAGYSIAKGAQSNINYPTAMSSRNLEDEASEAEAEIGGTLGVKFEIKALGTDSGIGWVLYLLGIEIDSISAEATSGLKTAFVSKMLNASAVQQKNTSSELAITLGIDMGAKLSETLLPVLNYFGVETTAEVKYYTDLIEPIKAKADFLFSSVSDNGQGQASVVGLMPNSYAVHLMTPNDYKGVLSIANTDSSVWNDISENISYTLDECAQNPDYKIVSPAIACAGWMCGVVEDSVELCKGRLSISDVYASARVGQLASSGASVINKAGDLTVHVSGTPLEPQSATLQMLADSAEYVVFEKVCPSAGVFRGTSTVTADGIGLSAEAKNVMVCTKDENKGDPHITTGDGLGYDYYASGDYILSRILDSDGNRVWGYEIQARFLPGFKTSWPQAVAVQVGADKVEIQGIATDGHGDGSGVKINTLAIWINGKQYYEESTNSYKSIYNINSNVIKLPSGGVLAITKKTSSNVLYFPASITIIWPEGTPTQNYGLVVNVTEAPTQPFIETLIARPDTFAGQERGLLGNNDGDPTNDFIRRNGEVLGVDHNMSFTELYALFGADWLVRPYESLFRNPEAIKPEFPADVVTLTAEQRALGEQACAALTGFYREACIIDVGLTGSVDLVKEYYANTEDLNALSDVIVTPNVDMARYAMSVADKIYASDSGYHLHYTQDITITQISGVGGFALIVRPPRGATATLGNGDTSYYAEGNQTTQLEVDCTTLNPETDKAYFSAEGAVQLWRQDPLSGALKELISEKALPCTDADKRPKYTLSLGTKEEQADSNDTHQHYTRQLMVKHESVDNGVFILDVTAPEGAIVKLNGSTTELNATGTGDYNASLELDCTNQTEINRNKGSIKLWEKDMLTQSRGYLYANYTLSCQKSKVLKTGQTTSYYPHDDGDYQMGEERSYTRDDAREVVVDNVTGLMWQDNEEAKTVTKPWVTQENYNAGKYDDTSGDTAATYCENLELGGYTDWRLPTSKELESIVDYGRYYPAIDTTYFNNVSSNYYWSATTSRDGSGHAWVVYFGYGYVGNYNKYVNLYVRCVRAGQ